MSKEKTSLHRSHSVASNFKLMLLSLLLAIFCSGIVASLGIYGLVSYTIFCICLYSSIAGTVICSILFLLFKR